MKFVNGAIFISISSLLFMGTMYIFNAVSSSTYNRELLIGRTLYWSAISFGLVVIANFFQSLRKQQTQGDIDIEELLSIEEEIHPPSTDELDMWCNLPLLPSSDLKLEAPVDIIPVQLEEYFFDNEENIKCDSLLSVAQYFKDKEDSIEEFTKLLSGMLFWKRVRGGKLISRQAKKLPLSIMATNNKIEVLVPGIELSDELLWEEIPQDFKEDKAGSGYSSIDEILDSLSDKNVNIQLQNYYNRQSKHLCSSVRFAPF